ncbi:L-aspartate oxidase [Pigmentiphaga humi]|uniref:L-aspartate oxidase n=1 Tax=Pigmentiphaga humi TaxID=2478468 RepID=A0A3P4AZZ9_9BURK|nr:FAD-binding protein [Pigmentiphaga humi]VCU69362.1 L-aspartate oxidase [Pigmentiphaga humi]
MPERLHASSDRYPPAGRDDALALETDVLVIGGSLAGAWAALSARRSGARVVLAEKGYVGTAGAAAPANVGGYYANPSDPEQAHKAVHARHASACDMDDLAHVRKVYVQSFHAYSELEALGFQFHSRPNGLSQMGRFIGGYTLHFLRQALKKAGVKILDHCPALELLRDGDGGIAGAAGIARQQRKPWTVRAGAVVAATGGGSFLSGAMGTRGLTCDGHLMAAEAGATLANLEFSALYGFAPLGSPSTKGFMYDSATFYDGNRRPLDAGSGRKATEALARAILETGGAYAVLDKAPEGFERWARLNHAVSFLYFDRLGINPFKDLWPLQMLLEGHTRGVGGLVIDARCATGVPGLYAAGDLTDRLRLVGAGMSGGGPAVAWCFASGQWAGEAAAAHALSRPASRGALQGLGTAGLRPRRQPRHDLADTVRDGTREEILPLQKHYFRSAATLGTSLDKLDALWHQARDHLAPEGPDHALAAREAAALAASARWLQTCALHRQETRGLHRRHDFPAQNAGGLLYTQRISGLDHPRLWREPLAWAQDAPPPLAGPRAAGDTPRQPQDTSLTASHAH